MTSLPVKPRKQLTNYTCGPASLRTIFHYYGVAVSEKELVDLGDIGEEGTDFSTMRKLSREYGFSFSARENGKLEEVKKWLEKGVPILICYQDHGPANGNNGHYAILTGVNGSWVEISDPANYWEGDGKKFASSKRMQKDVFLKRWFEMDNGIKIKRWFAIIKPRKPRKK